MEKELVLKENGKIVSKGREFTRLIGGFGEDKPIMTTKQIADLMNYELRTINQTMERNIKYFEENVDIIDLKKIITESDHLLKLGYSIILYKLITLVSFQFIVFWLMDVLPITIFILLFSM